MKLEHRIKPSLHETLEKYIILSIVFCFLSFTLPMHSKAENDPLILHYKDLPSYSGKLDLTQLNQEIIQKNSSKSKEKKNEIKLSNTAQNKEIRLSPHYSSSIQVEEHGANLMIVEGSKFPHEYDKYNSSTNHNNGFYMNIINPDGSSLNFGSYFNSSTHSGNPRHRSSSQIIVDKME